MRAVLAVTLACMLSVQSFGQDLRTFTEDEHGFTLRYPSDWTVKEGEFERTAFKAVKKSDDGQLLVFIVNIQPVDPDTGKLEDLLDETNAMAGAENVTVLDSGRGRIGGVPCVRMMIDPLQLPLLGTRVRYVTYVIRGNYLYTVIVSCNKSLFPEYADLLRRLRDSFVFTSPLSTVGATTPKASYNSGNFRLVVKKPEEKPLVALLKAIGEVFLKLVLVVVLLAAASAVWSKIRPKKRAEVPPSEAPHDDEE